MRCSFCCLVCCVITWIEVSGLAVRLTGGSTRGRGRVEVYHDGQWGSICDDFWDADDAQVMCRQMGYSRLIGAHAFQFGEKNGPYLLDDVACTGSEVSIEECTHEPWTSHNCEEGEAAGVECDGQAPLVRLIGGPVGNAGRVEVYHTGQWHSVCDNGWGMEEANVVCRQVGYSEGAQRSSTGSEYGSGTGRYIVGGVECAGGENFLDECHHTPWDGMYSCESQAAAGAVCSGQGLLVRLSDGTDASNGRLELHYDGQWGMVCDDDWDISDATVVCRQLGYSFAERSSVNSEFGTGEVRHFWLDEVKCLGMESSVAECAHPTWGQEDCDVYESAGVVCGKTGVPVAPSDISLQKSTSRSLTVSWLAGYDGGLQQTFTVSYGPVGDLPAIGSVRITATESKTIYIRKFMEGLIPGKSYVFSLSATNDAGTTHAPPVTFRTKESPGLHLSAHDVTIRRYEAYINIHLTNPDSVSHVIVMSCDQMHPSNCTSVRTFNFPVRLLLLPVPIQTLAVIAYDGNEIVDSSNITLNVPTPDATTIIMDIPGGMPHSTWPVTVHVPVMSTRLPREKLNDTVVITAAAAGTAGHSSAQEGTLSGRKLIVIAGIAVAGGVLVIIVIAGTAAAICRAARRNASPPAKREKRVKNTNAPKKKKVPTATLR